VPRLHVDWTRCDGHGLCAALLPEHITRDEWGFPVLHDAPISAEQAKRAIAACPALALYLNSDRQPTNPKVSR